MNFVAASAGPAGNGWGLTVTGAIGLTVRSPCGVPTATGLAAPTVAVYEPPVGPVRIRFGLPPVSCRTTYEPAARPEKVYRPSASELVAGSVASRRPSWLASM